MKNILLVFAIFAYPFTQSFAQTYYWGNLGINLDFLVDRPEGASETIDLSAVVSARMDLPLGTRFIQFSPEIYLVRKGNYLIYGTNGSKPLVGALDVRGAGIGVPLALHLTNSNGTGVRFSGGFFGEYNYNPQFAILQNIKIPLEFRAKRDQFDYGPYAAIHLVLDNQYELKLTYLHGLDKKTYRSEDPKYPVQGSWAGIYRYFTITLGYSISQ